MSDKEFDNLYQQVQFAVECKAQEFRQNGYRDVSSNDVWGCLTTVYWRHKPTLMLHQAVSDIFGLSQKEIIDYLQLQTFKQPKANLSDVFAQIIE
ncbi:post-transcriptional regulator [Culicoidibacter larvae]|uniref:post-transcriptional regulator n=1 Tax=Culicoidibacter larvae TaxID=2579976 RepID=UPI001484DF75|nr:post-transcriptional regulator [Culicoidibacter larvae]